MSKLCEILESIATAIACMTLIIVFLCRVIIVDGSSMENTLHNGEKIIISNFMYTPKKGDIIVTDKNNAYNEPLIKRVIATGGDRIEIKYDLGEVYLNGELLSENYIKEDMEYNNKENLDLIIPDGYIFIMGDNRNNSYDSRDFGVINQKDILGHAKLRISPISKFGWMR